MCTVSFMPKPHTPAIKAIRKLQHLSYSQVAQRAKISRQHARRIEVGDSGASKDVLAALADALEVPLDAISVPEPEAL